MVHLEGDVTVSGGHLVFDGVDVAELARRVADAVLSVLAAAHPREREQHGRGVHAPPPRHRDLLCEQGLLEPLVPGSGAPRRHQRRGQLGGRALEGPASRLCAAADHLQRRRQDARRDPRGRRGGRQGAHGRLALRARADRRGGRRARPAGRGRPAGRRQRADAHPPRPGDRPRRQGRHRPGRRAGGVRASPAPTKRSTPAACTCTWARRSPASSRTSRPSRRAST